MVSSSLDLNSPVHLVKREYQRLMLAAICTPCRNGLFCRGGEGAGRFLAMGVRGRQPSPSFTGASGRVMLACNSKLQLFAALVLMFSCKLRAATRNDHDAPGKPTGSRLLL